jgi:hypothetical protein
MVGVGLANHAHAQTTCASESTKVKAVTIAEDYFPVTTEFQFDRPNLQTLLKTTVVVEGTTSSCLLAYFSAVATPTDNYMVFQISINGVPMKGHHTFYAVPATPIVIESEETDQNLPRMVAHHAFQRVAPGSYTIEVKVAAGSSALSPAAVSAPVLTVHYR